ncbi:hypothetical protein CBW24_11230 [Pacificitalea manganoxidans]|uniref:DUF4169 domain-containing protein n=1 Tax=Pacificitalea manganoxidans TaxID=1411902 RepID=A0A291M0R9_9RHOB|nr:DUF4169 family protein [Pacificitalea manganoxidans]ATI42522.1 hypothetical protein CBW24_11230 [Pacificitalea manganoxidans]MDR6307616.1 regulator of protease activity HflC (stomatin/prohibitin superfamily) [Pacificitalea manganoxidans]
MADTPINLNRVRKERARSARKAAAERNAVLHGLTKAQKTAARGEAERISKLHDAARRDDSAPDRTTTGYAAPEHPAPDHSPSDHPAPDDPEHR